MKKINIVIAFLLTGIALPVFAELPDNVRDNLPELIKVYCNSSVEYSLDESIGVWDEEEKIWSEGSQAAEFHKVIGCTLESALAEVSTHSKVEAEKAYNSSLPMETYSFTGTDCGSLRLGTIQATQQANGFKSECARSEVAEISQIFSSCQVAETLMNEWCGYDLFLYAKSQDEESFRALDGDMGFETGDRSLKFGDVETRIAKERLDAEVAVFDSIAWYMQTEHVVRQSPWVVAINEKLLSVKLEWSKIRSALNTFKDKFFNASAPPA